MAGEIVFCLEDVDFAYSPGCPAVREVDLVIRAGERLALVGANGCGKSTLQKLLDGLLFPTAGRISAFGEPLTEERLCLERSAVDFRRRVALLFQHPEMQLFNSTVRDEIAFGPRQLLPPAEAEERASCAIDFLGLSHLADRPPYGLSGGEQKMVALASLLAINPEVLILDEPTGGLDPRSRRWVVGLLQQLGQAGKTLILATHHLELLPELADRVVVMGEDHRLAAVGPPGEILADRALLLATNLVDGEEGIL